MTESVVVVVAHPDDEVLGCGGTIARHAEMGDNVNVIIAAEGAMARYESTVSKDAIHKVEALKRSAQMAAEILGARDVRFFGFPDNQMDTLSELTIVRMVEKEINDCGASIVYCHHSDDVNVDHRMLHRAVVTACRPFPGQTVRRLLSCEVMSSTEWQPGSAGRLFVPSWYVDITRQLGKKLKALEAYSQEMRGWPHARSVKAVEHLARVRGSQVGIDAAEAFCLLRQLQQ